MSNIADEIAQTVKITGHSKPVERYVTGMHSFDRAFINQRGAIGFPLGKITELWGSTHVGKSTIVHSLSGMIASRLDKNVVLADLEDFDPEFLISIYTNQGFAGHIHSILEETDEDNLQEMLGYLQKDGYAVGILDSVGAVSPYGERTGDFGERKMGQRAFLMAQFSRRAVCIARSSDEHKSVFLINHQHLPLGGFGGYKPPGGETKGYLSSIRISTNKWFVKTTKSRLFNKKAEQRFPDGSYCIHAKVVKNSWGLEGKEFYLFVLSGKGVHRGLTAMLDAFILGKVERGRKYLKISDENYMSLPDLISDAQEGKTESFDPFYDVLEEKENDK